MKQKVAPLKHQRLRPKGAKLKLTLRKSSQATSMNPVLAEVDNLRVQLGSQNSLAQLLGVDRSSVTRWIKGEDFPDPENEEKIIALRYVITRLTRIFKEEVAASWLQGINALLGNQRPIDLLRSGRVAEVMSAIEQTETGSYA